MGRDCEAVTRNAGSLPGPRKLNSARTLWCWNGNWGSEDWSYLLSVLAAGRSFLGFSEKGLSSPLAAGTLNFLAPQGSMGLQDPGTQEKLTYHLSGSKLPSLRAS